VVYLTKLSFANNVYNRSCSNVIISRKGTLL